MSPIALASGVVPGLTPQETVTAAIAGGFDAVGLWVEPDQWTGQTFADVNQMTRDAGLFVMDVEVIWIKPGPLDPAHLRILDIGLEVGARNALVVSSDPDMGATTAKFAALCKHVAGTPLRVALEFGIFTDVKSIGMAEAVLRDVADPATALLVDAIHLDRSGGTAADVAKLPAAWLSYAQLCDAPAKRPDPANFDAVIEDAVFLRRQLGEGDLAVGDLVSALPRDIPVSVELRSRALYEKYPDPGERAKAVADATRRFLQSHSQPMEPQS